MGIPENIKRLREIHNLSQEDFGKIANVSDKAVSSWENGTREPRMGAIQKLADYFGIQKSDIIEDSDESKQPYYLDPKMVKLIQDLKDKPKLIQLNRRAKNLSETQLDAIMRITEEFISQDKEMTEIDDDI